ncbi:putative opt oligopeptide transporter protein [Eutypa lata UCREL1]|uniref:Putative opt oligopeptide transporter protein n=1 Tax=Eutypa lata (strain UCR-EL1) TaxID=1287681 RepID=M7SWP0_EUTLA|nr:putative opt oligopeptide transporter protein [Eutypa lata UCREL1]
MPGIIQTEKPVASDYVDEKSPQVEEEYPPNSEIEVSLSAQVEQDLNVTEDDLVEAHDLATKWTLDDIRPLMEKVLVIHEHDPNFPLSIIDRIKAFLGNDDIAENPEKYAVLIEEMKLEAALITVNSPYAEVRAVVDNHDDENIPCGTIRAWAIGIWFVVILAFINQLFSIRQPAITVQANVAQLLAYPLGKACEKFLPDVGVTVWGIRHSLNPGPFSRKEQMLVTILANVAWNTPYTNNIIWVQYLSFYFNQHYAGQFLYQILIALATNFIGNLPVQSPWGKIFKISQLRFFAIAFVGMFVYFWFPQYIFTALSMFSWLSWIDPNNLNLATITGFNNGLGINPWPTWDWNTMLFDATDPLVVPFFSGQAMALNFIGACISGCVIAALWYTNSNFTGYLPINSNRVYDNTGQLYNVSRTVDVEGLFSDKEYQSYSFPFLSSGNLVVYLFFFSIYSATISYAYLYHRHEIAMGFRNLVNSFRRTNKKTEVGYDDIHNQLMAKYDDAPEWCVVFLGLLLCTLFLVPVGIIKAMTGIEVTLNALIEFIGGTWVNGNALAMNFFKCFGYVTCAHAIWFSNDLKLAHYAKIPPRQTFSAQMIGTLLSTFICIGVLNFQMTKIPDVCTSDAPNRFTCPHINTFFTASVLWGTIGPVRVFGSSGMYTWLLAGFPIGFVVPIIFYYLSKKFKRTWMRQIHPVALFYGAVMRHYLSFWSKYNFVLSASFSSAIAIAAILIFFFLQLPEIELNWWGNSVVEAGCEGKVPCVLKTVADGEYFGPRIGEFH